MNIKLLMEQLQELLDGGLDPNSIVYAYDPEDGCWMPVTGVVFGGGSVELQTDDPT